MPSSFFLLPIVSSYFISVAFVVFDCRFVVLVWAFASFVQVAIFLSFVFPEFAIYSLLDIVLYVLVRLSVTITFILLLLLHGVTHLVGTLGLLLQGLFSLISFGKLYSLLSNLFFYVLIFVIC